MIEDSLKNLNYVHLKHLSEPHVCMPLLMLQT